MTETECSESEGSRVIMTMRVSRDSGRTWDKPIVVREGDPIQLLAEPIRYPACSCTRCVSGRSVPARRLAPADQPDLRP